MLYGQFLTVALVAGLFSLPGHSQDFRAELIPVLTNEPKVGPLADEAFEEVKSRHYESLKKLVGNPKDEHLKLTLVTSRKWGDVATDPPKPQYVVEIDASNTHEGKSVRYPFRVTFSDPEVRYKTVLPFKSATEDITGKRERHAAWAASQSAKLAFVQYSKKIKDREYEVGLMKPVEFYRGIPDRKTQPEVALFMAVYTVTFPEPEIIYIGD